MNHRRRRYHRTAAVLTSGALALSGCTSPSADNQAAITRGRPAACHYDEGRSAVLGALAGAILGALIAGKNNRGAGIAAGGIVGGTAGLGIAQYLQQRCQALASARAAMLQTQLTFGTVSVPVREQGTKDNDGVVATATSSSMFNSGSAELTPVGRVDVSRLAQAFQGTNRKVLIVGHTDSVGTSDTNQRLSEMRALEVARVFQSMGIPPQQIYYKGAGTSEPVADNATESGRAANRRVDVVELSSEERVLAYDDMASSNPEYLKRQFTGHSKANREATTSEKAAIPKKSVPGAKSNGAVAALHSGTRFDFGGVSNVPGSTNASKLIGAVQDTSGGDGFFASIIPAAEAATLDSSLVDTACISSSQPASGYVHSLATGKAISRQVADYFPGLYGTSWTKTLNGNLVGYTNISVLRDGGKADAAPTTYIFANYKSGNQKPSLTAIGQPKSYLGERGVLYRIYFPPSAWPLRCSDLVFPLNQAGRTAYAKLYYDKAGQVYSVGFIAESQASKH